MTLYAKLVSSRFFNMNYLLGLVLGYVIHDAIKPTVVGKVLDKVSLPGDLLSKAGSDPSSPAA